MSTRHGYNSLSTTEIVNLQAALAEAGRKESAWNAKEARWRSKETEWDMMKSEFIKRLQELSDEATKHLPSVRITELSIAADQSSAALPTDAMVRRWCHPRHKRIDRACPRGLCTCMTEVVVPTMHPPPTQSDADCTQHRGLCQAD